MMANVFCVDASSDIITAICKHFGFKNFIIGLRNSLTHGQLLDACNISFTDDDLIKLMDNLDFFMDIVKDLDCYD